MKARKILLLITLIVLVMGFSSGRRATAEATTHEISDQCKAEIRTVLENCHQACGRDIRCFIRCVVNNLPPCVRSGG